MITRVSRKELDIEKYNTCITNALQTNVFGYSWYLDEVCTNWDVLVLNDYEAVMPIPWRKKYFLKYVYIPLWLIELGIYSPEVEDENEFLIELFDDFKFIETKTNTHNSFSMFDDSQKDYQRQVLYLKESYKTLFYGYRKDRKKDLKRAAKNDLTERWNDKPEKLITLFKTNVGKRVRKIKEEDYNVLLRLMNVCIEKRKGEILSVYNGNNEIVASGFFLKHAKKATILVSSTDFKNRKNGANTFLINSAIYKYQPNFEVFDFGGSVMKSIATYFLSFGATTEKYIYLKHNNLPKLLRFFKK